MKSLLRFEMRKLGRQKSFYICTLVMVVMLVLTGLTANLIVNIGKDVIGEIDTSALTISSALDFVVQALGNSSFAMVIGIFTALFVCADYELQIVKTIYARGYSRQSVYLAKMVVLWIASSVMFVVIELFAFAFGAAYYGADGFNGIGFLGVLGAQYLVFLANTAFYYALCSVIKKIGLSIAACIFVPSIINLILTLVDSALKLKDFSVANVWVSSLLSNISSVSVDAKWMIISVAASVVYMLLFLIVGFQFSRRTEV